MPCCFVTFYTEMVVTGNFQPVPLVASPLQSLYSRTARYLSYSCMGVFTFSTVLLLVLQNSVNHVGFCSLVKRIFKIRKGCQFECPSTRLKAAR